MLVFDFIAVGMLVFLLGMFVGVLLMEAIWKMGTRKGGK